MKHRTQVLLEDKHYVFLKERAIQERKSLSAILRRILDEAERGSREQTHDPVLDIIGKFASGHTDTAERAEDILYGEE